MRHLISKVEDLPEDHEPLWEMSNLFPKHTGLPFTIWVSVKGNARHHCRIKVMVEGGDFSVTVPDMDYIGSHANKVGTSDRRKIEQFITDNKSLLISLWNGEIDVVDFVNGLKRL